MPYFKQNYVFAGRYLLVELLSEVSSLEEVWKAKDELADHALVVVKIHVSGKGLDDTLVRQFRSEFSFSNYLSHPHLIKIHHFDISEREKAAYLVMPFCPTGSLKKLLENEANFSERQVAMILSQIGSALEFLHTQEPPIRHQSVRPENILLAQPDYSLLSVSGISDQNKKVFTEQEAYAPPEYFDRNQEGDTSGDIFSLGVTLYVMCTKTIPWEGEGGQSLLTVGELLSLPKHYSPELNELLQACMSANCLKRPSAGELHLRGKHYLETGSWNLPEKGEKESNSFKLIKNILPYLLGAAVLGLFIFSAFWEYKDNPLDMPQKKLQELVSSNSQEDQQEVDAMLIEMLEEERNDLARRNLELERKNQQLMYFDSVNTATLRKQGISVEKPPVSFADNSSALVPEENKAVTLPDGIEKQLNKISDPELSANARTSWKEETMAQFAEGTIRILDETDGKPKQYSASIFLNLLYKVPHHIVVKEVKRDQNKKVTELRLTMETRM